MQWPPIVHLFTLKTFFSWWSVSQSVSHRCFFFSPEATFFLQEQKRHDEGKMDEKGEMSQSEKQCANERMREREREREGHTHRGRKEAIWINAIICTHTHIHRKQREREAETPTTTTATRHPTDYVVFSFALRLSFAFSFSFCAHLFYHHLISFIDFNF